MSIIGAGNALGDTVPAFCIFKQWPSDMEDWNVEGLDADIRFYKSDTAFKNAEITLDWIRLFNKHSFALHAEVQRRGISFEDWFGCDHDNYSPALGIPFVNPDDVPPEYSVRMSTPREERIYRLLILDNFTGHYNLDFYEYCLSFDIIVIFLPPHSTHLIQPMDAGVFHSLKETHKRSIERILLNCESAFTREDFITLFRESWLYGFTRGNIMAGFEKTGVYPPFRDIVINQIKYKN